MHPVVNKLIMEVQHHLPVVFKLRDAMLAENPLASLQRSPQRLSGLKRTVQSRASLNPYSGWCLLIGIVKEAWSQGWECSKGRIYVSGCLVQMKDLHLK